VFIVVSPYFNAWLESVTSYFTGTSPLKASTEQQKFGKKFVFFPRKGLYFSNMINFIAPEDICLVIHKKNPPFESSSPSGLQANLL
jgi:hypothetical protein